MWTENSVKMPTGQGMTLVFNVGRRFGDETYRISQVMQLNGMSGNTSILAHERKDDSGEI